MSGAISSSVKRSLGWDVVSVDLSVDSTTVVATACLVKGWEVSTTMSAHICHLQNDTTPITTIPASTTAGTGVEYLEPLRFGTSLVVNPDNSATGVITVFYRPLGVS